MRHVTIFICVRLIAVGELVQKIDNLIHMNLHEIECIVVVERIAVVVGDELRGMGVS